MKIGQIFRNQERVQRALKPGYGVAARVTEDGKIIIGGEPKVMANLCHEVASNIVGLKVSFPGCKTAVIVKGGDICNRSESSALCQGCLGLL